MEHNIVIDRQVDAPCHGKGNVDGHTAVDKRYLTEMMKYIHQRERDEDLNKMKAETMDGSIKISFEEQAVKFCSDEKRETGVKSEAKYKKRENLSRTKKRFYHLQKYKDIQYNNIKVKLTGI